MRRKDALYRLVERFKRAPLGSREKDRAKEEAVTAYEYLVLGTFRMNFMDLPPGIDQEDILQFGRIALYHSLEDYDPDRPDAADFETYAITNIRRAMGRGIKELSASQYGRECEFSLSRARKEFMKEHDREPSDEELADALGITVCVLRNKRASADANYPLYLSQRAYPNSAEGDGKTIQDIISGSGSIETDAIRKVQVDTIREALSQLHPELQSVGALILQDLSVRQIADTMHLSRKQANAMACTVRRKIRKWIIRNGHEDLFEEFIRNRRRRRSSGAVCGAEDIAA